jgi:hypothetical protein
VITLADFVRESNRIEGIHRDPTPTELHAHERLLGLDSVTVGELEDFVHRVAGAELRRVPGMDVRVGRHVPPLGGPHIEARLDNILAAVRYHELGPYEAHRQYEILHPFRDGNGRSGRALWAWQMRRDGRDPFALPFLHAYYYQSLDAAR